MVLLRDYRFRHSIRYERIFLYKPIRLQDSIQRQRKSGKITQNATFQLVYDLLSDGNLRFVKLPDKFQKSHHRIVSLEFDFRKFPSRYANPVALDLFLCRHFVYGIVQFDCINIERYAIAR